MAQKDKEKLVGKNFGMLTVISYLGRKNNKYYWNVICSCEAKTIKAVREDALLGSKTKSCGCQAPNTNGPKRSLQPKEDLSGRMFGKLKVIKFDSWQDDKRRRPYYLCKCTCSEDFVLVRADCLTSGNTQSCGCLVAENISGGRKRLEFPTVDLTGKTYSRLKVLRFGFRDEKRFYWECECSCGNMGYYRGDSLIDGTTKSCGCLPKENKGPRPKEDREVKVLNDIYRTYLKEDKFNIEYARLVLIVQSPCWYCNGFDIKYDSLTKEYFYINGIDRYDNNKGYLLYNVVPCCIKCNKMKRNLAIDEFVNWIIRFNQHNRKVDYQVNFPKNVPVINQTLKQFAKTKYRNTRYDADKQKRIFQIPEELFNQVIIQPCKYCGSFNKETKDGHLVNGIDRVINSQGYIVKNIVPCCTICNMTKHTHPLAEFINHVYKLLPFAIEMLKK